MISEERYLELIQVCNTVRPLYMQGAYTGVSDELYDSYINDIREYETCHTPLATSPTQSVNPDLGDGNVKHEYPMLSLLDVFTKEDAVDFLKRYLKDTPYDVEYKLDGLSVQLIYQEGTLISASTRGDGLVGVECIEAAKHIKSIPWNIDTKSRLIIRGEVFMSKSRFEEYCIKYGKQANPRNTAVGAFKRKSELERAEYLTFKAFNLENAIEIESGTLSSALLQPGSHITRHSQSMQVLDALGFDTVKRWLIDKEDDLTKILDDVYQNREGEDIPIDGMVIKVDDLVYRTKLSDNGRIPHWAVAYKFPAKEQETKLKGVEWQVGATGALTPVAILDPVLVMGSTITKATLHNNQRIKDLGLQLGDMVVVYKAGDIIPAIKSCRHTTESVDLIFPTTCPSCGHALVNDMCTNIQCDEKLIARLSGWMDKKVGNFKGVGASIVSALYERKKLRTPADFYKIKPIEIMTLPGSGRAKMNTFMQRVNESKTAMTFTQVLVGLGINDLAQASAAKIDMYLRRRTSRQDFTFKDALHAFSGMGLYDLISVLGEAKGTSVYNQLQEEFILEIIKEIEEVFQDRKFFAD